MRQSDLHNALFAVLSAHAPLVAKVKSIYDDVPQAIDGAAASRFPYIAVGESGIVAFDTDTRKGGEATIVIYAVSRYAGNKEVAELNDLVYAALDEKNLDMVGIDCLTCFRESVSITRDVDGKTRMGQSSFKIIYRSAYIG